MGKKRAWIKDIQLTGFYDLVGEVVKFYSSTSDTTDVYITDYTTNPLLYNYEDPSKSTNSAYDQRHFPGPYGQMTIVLRLFEPHSTHFKKQNLREGDFVYVQNVRPRLSNANFLEGWVQEDKQFPKDQIHKLTRDAQKKELLASKAEWEKQQAEGAVADAPNEPKKASARSAAKKREERREKKEMERMQKEIERKELEQKAEEERIARAGTNTHVRAQFPQIQLSTLKEVIHNPDLHTTSHKGDPLTVPFVNVKHRIRVRVVDFAPRDIKDFSHSRSDSAGNTSGTGRGRWAWGFYLLVEDAKPPPGETPERLRVIVTNENAQHLLKMDAKDLHDPHTMALSRLEEKMFILWGNLLELKRDLEPQGVRFPLPSGDSRLQNMPFDCCIHEYGVEVPESDSCPLGWQRMHGMFGTSIMDDSVPSSTSS